VTQEELAPELETEGLDEAAAAEPGRTSAWSASRARFPALRSASSAGSSRIVPIAGAYYF